MPIVQARSGHVDRVVGAAFALVVTATWLGVAGAQGALGASRNDDWTYYRIALHLADTRQFLPDPYTKAMLVGQVVMSQPVIAVSGHELMPLQVFVALLGGAGLWASYSFVRLLLPRGWALLAVGVLALGPIYGSISTTYMSDVPAFAVQAIALRVAAAALRRAPTSWTLYGASLGVSVVAFTIREYAVATTLAIVVTALVVTWDRPRSRVAVAVSGIVVLALMAAMFVWRAKAAGGSPSAFVLSASRDDARLVVRLLFTLGLLVLPVGVAVLAAAARAFGQATKSRVVWAVAVSGAIVAVWAVTSSHVLGNYVYPMGSYRETLHGEPPQIISPTLWLALQGAALVVVIAVSTLVCLRVRTPSTRRPPGQDGVALVLGVAFVIATVTVVVGVSLLTKNSVFDRYLLPVVPVAAALVLRVALPSGRGFVAGASALALVAFAAMGFRYVETTATFDGAKWRLAESVRSQGYEAATINGGLEWFGLHQPGPVQAFREMPQGTDFWLGLFENPRVCVQSRFVPTRSEDAASAPAVARLRVTSLTGVTYALEAVPVDVGCDARSAR